MDSGVVGLKKSPDLGQPLKPFSSLGLARFLRSAAVDHPRIESRAFADP